MTELVFAWPPKELSPNARVHWAQKSKAAKAYRKDCWAITKQSGFKAPESERLHLWVDFYPPSKRHYDDDNLIASFKAGRDGIADALGIDDKRFVTHPYRKDVVGGYVKVRITGAPE